MKRKLITLSIVAVVLLGLGILCGVRWNVWFGNPPEPAFVASDSICRVQLTFGRAGVMSRAVSWQCGDSVEDAKLLLISENNADTQYVTASSRLFETLGGRTVCYWAYTDSLAAGNYRYAAQVGDKISSWNEFSVAKPDDHLKFVYIGDVQDTLHGTLREHFAKIQRAETPDFWLFGGDLIERPHDQYWNEYFTAVRDFCSTVPIVAIAGNHEYIKALDRRLEQRFVCVFPYFLKNDSADFAALASFKWSNASLFLLDSNNDAWTFPRQRAWLKQNFAENGSKWNIASLHHPVYSLRGKVNNLLVRWAFASPLNSSVDLVLEGHEHAYARRSTDGITPLYVVSQCSAKDYRISFDSGYERYGVGQRFYQVVSIAGDTLQLTTHTLDGAIYDEVFLVKTAAGVEVIDHYSDRSEQLTLDPTRYRKSAEKQDAYRREMEKRLEIFN